MTRDEIILYIRTKVIYDILTPNYLLSKWVQVNDIETVISLKEEIPHLYVDEKGKRFRLRIKRQII